MDFQVVYLAAGVGVLALLYAYYLVRGILERDAGTPKMREISEAIADGAKAYLMRQLYTILAFAVVVGVVVWFGVGQAAAISFVAGAACSYIAAVIGMSISVRANVRTAQAAKKGLKEALDVAFKGGSVTGLSVVGLGLIGVAATTVVFNSDVSALIGFGLGASLISLFARVGGGIYTKAADVGADLVGKLEAGIPEDDPRNPAVIADNVGDNVGDCAGMGADLFESFVVTIIAAMLIGIGLTSVVYPGGEILATLPLLVASAGVAASVFGTMFVRLGPTRRIMAALNKGIYATIILFAGLAYVALGVMGVYGMSIGILGAVLVGLVLTVAVSHITEYYTSKHNAPVQEIVEASRTGAGTNLISGMAVGMQSTALPILAIVIGIMLSYQLAGVYGIAIAAVAMLSCTGIIVAIDSYGPITDNAGGIAEMAKLEGKVRRVTDELDAVGNTTKATTKGFAIASAALSALSLFVAYAESVGLSSINILRADVVIGMLIGALLPFLFSSFLMKAVGRAAFKMVEEVRRQFRQIKGIMKGTAKPDYAKCVDISTTAALKELTAPALLAVAAPLLVGWLFGPAALGGLLAGAIMVGLPMALFMSNSGAAWDNAKKYIEEGNLGGKGGDAHKAAVVGDTVGDPFKDTAGPALNSLIKVLNTVALIAAGFLVANSLNLL
ncbi:MAG: sodium-translocating pyrophosphatase [Candidatus Micrarchaeota archaeon]